MIHSPTIIRLDHLRDFLSDILFKIPMQQKLLFHYLFNLNSMDDIILLFTCILYYFFFFTFINRTLIEKKLYIINFLLCYIVIKIFFKNDICKN